MSQSGIISVTGSSPSIPTSFVTNSGTATPAANIIQVLGINGVTTAAPGPSNIITIDVTGSGVLWVTTNASQTLIVQRGYICSGPATGNVQFNLPATSALGDVIEITLDGSTSFSVVQSAGQSIRLGNISTTVGVGGSLSSTQQGDSIRMVCQTANLKWNVISSVGTLSLV